ncbi:MAG TPA: Mur ligase family protein, partial [Candidatus Woesebacteria bacterium]|nr:Mur ligase family protein [Candidatus Woesebacteria bacterium]
KDLTVIGVAGSFGKTSVKEFLYHFLAEQYGQDKVLKTERNTNTQLGVAQTILNDLTSQHLFFICEMGAYRVGEIAQSAELARPSIGILTGINNQHLSLFGSQENIIKAKYELIQSLPPTGYSIFNGDNDYCLDLYRQTSDRKILVSSKGLRLAHWQAQEVLIGKDSVSFKMANRDQEILISAKLVGRQNIVNLLLAGSAALVLGLSPNELSQAAKTLPTPSGGPRMVPYRQASIINAVYSSNLDGAQVHIEHLELWSG